MKPARLIGVLTERQWRAIEAADRHRREIQALMRPGTR